MLESCLAVVILPWIRATISPCTMASQHLVERSAPSTWRLLCPWLPFVPSVSWLMLILSKPLNSEKDILMVSDTESRRFKFRKARSSALSKLKVSNGHHLEVVPTSSSKVSKWLRTHNPTFHFSIVKQQSNCRWWHQNWLLMILSFQILRLASLSTDSLLLIQSLGWQQKSLMHSQLWNWKSK